MGLDIGLGLLQYSLNAGLNWPPQLSMCTFNHMTHLLFRYYLHINAARAAFNAEVTVPLDICYFLLLSFI